MLRSLSYIFNIYIILLGTCATGLLAQTSSRTPALYPANISVFDIDAGLPISCAYDGMVDQNGRLWINPCFVQEEHQTVDFYTFDGKHSAFIEWKNLPPGLKGQAVLAGFAPNGELYGFFRHTGTCFFFNPSTQKARFHTLDTAGVVINLMGNTATHGFIIHAISPANHLVYQLRQDRALLLLTLPRQDTLDTRYPLWTQENTLLTETELWFSDLGSRENIKRDGIISQFGSIIRFHLDSRRVRKYGLRDFFPKKIPIAEKNRSRFISTTPDGHILVRLNAWDRYFTIDSRTDSIRAGNPLQAADSFFRQGHPLTSLVLKKSRDQVGNLLYWYKLREGAFRALLWDKDGRWFDYTAVIEGVLEASQRKNGAIFNIQGADFKRQAHFFTTGGLAIADLKLSASIKSCMHGFGARAIAELSPGQYIVIKYTGIHVFNPNINLLANRTKQLGLKCLKSEPQRQIKQTANLVKGPSGNFWVPFNKQIIQFRANGDCTSFPIGVNFEKFTFISPEHIALVGEEQLFIYHTPSKKTMPYLIGDAPLKIKSVVNQVYFSKDSVIWVASLEGLHKIDLKKNQYRLIGHAEGFQDKRMMCIDEDAQGRLWIGTYGGGLHIYNPSTGALSVIDEKQGLSNNIVVGILKDDSGVRWLSTYKGITLVSAKGAVLARLFQEDGLNNNEFNRYSYFKGSSGDLFFGTISGINVIKPEAVKAQLLGTTPVSIFLTRLTYFDAGIDSLINKIIKSNNTETVQLTASHRSISLQFALSSLVLEGKNSFAYKLAGKNITGFNDWVYIGTNNTLNLQSLPAGEYNILIKGCDYRGNWTAEPLVIAIQASEFFYKQTWFILLCIFAFGSLALGWIYRQRIERKKLENELQQRTVEIMRARDQMVVQEKLASLGKLTAGIAHEIKNPLNFVNNFALDSTLLVERLIGELEKGKSGIDPKLFGRMMHYLLEIKQNALDINNSGNTADQIISSMMNHARGDTEAMKLLNINHLIEENLHLAISSFKASHSGFLIDVQASFDPNMRQVYGSPLNLARAILNILNNACFALADKQQQADKLFEPVLQVQTKALKRYVTISIRDNGPGIDPEIVNDIFTPFFTTKPTGEGNVGLGLSICHDIIVTEHKGKIEVKSEPGNYTEFTLKIPTLGETV